MYNVSMKNRKINRPTSTRYYWTAEQKLAMREMYEVHEMAIEDVAIHFDTSRETVRYHLRRAGVVLRGRACMTERAKDKQRGPKHHSWKGGRYKHRSGYYYALARGHPLSKDGYIYEHRLVMEKHLQDNHPDHPAIADGFLSRKWVVHHMNGQKDDNRIENLELMERGKHHSWLHFQDEMQRLKELLEANNISY